MTEAVAAAAAAAAAAAVAVGWEGCWWLLQRNYTRRSLCPIQGARCLQPQKCVALAVAEGHLASNWVMRGHRGRFEDVFDSYLIVIVLELVPGKQTRQSPLRLQGRQHRG
jgi:hypothetical protein